jgi:hypothetical protein
MRMLAASAGTALIVLGFPGTAEAQPRYRAGYYGRVAYPYHYNRGAGWGGALAAGLVGGALLGGLAAATYAYPSYPYGYPGYGYGPVYGGNYYPAPVYRPVRRYGSYHGPGPAYSVDPYAAPHEIRDGYRTIYVPGRGRIISAWPAY